MSPAETNETYTYKPPVRSVFVASPEKKTPKPKPKKRKG